MSNTLIENSITLLLSTLPELNDEYHTYKNVSSEDIKDFSNLEHVLSIITSESTVIDESYTNIAFSCSNNVINDTNIDEFLSIIQKYNAQNKFQFKIKVFGKDNIFWNDITEERILSYKNNNISINFMLDSADLNKEVILEFKDKVDYVNNLIYTDSDSEVSNTDKKQLLHLLYSFSKDTTDKLDEYYQDEEMLPLVTSVGLFPHNATVFEKFDYNSKYVIKNNIFIVNTEYPFESCNTQSYKFSVDLVNNRLIKCTRMYDVSPYVDYSDDVLLSLLKKEENTLSLLDESICKNCKMISKNRTLYSYFTNSF